MANNIPGTSGNDILFGTNGSDAINTTLLGFPPIPVPGTAGNDQLFGRAGNDILLGGTGHDRLNGGAGNDHLDGGAGIDTADYSSGILNGQSFTGATAGVVVNLNAVGPQNTGEAGFDTLVSIENLTGTNFDDHLTGNGANNVLYGLSGKDVLSGGPGGTDTMYGGDHDDHYYVHSVDDVVVESHNDALGGVDTVHSSVSHTLSFGVEHLHLGGFFETAINGAGNGNHNNITGNGANNLLWGLAGNDQLWGAGGNDTLDGGTGADNMDGGMGSDTYIVDSIFDVTAESFPDAGVDAVQSSAAFHTIGFGIENLTLTGVANINGTGNANNNIINGNSGNNVLSGLAGHDQLNGGNGNDRLDGGVGTDNMDGGFGNDIYVVDQIGDVVKDPDILVNVGDRVHVLSGGNDTVESSITYTLGATIENLALSGGAAINGTGNETNNVIDGNGANNVLSGRAGNDRLLGGNGNDTLNGGTGDDRLDGGTGNDKLKGEVGNDLLNGGAGSDSLTGGLGADTFLLRGVIESQPGVLNRDVIADFSGGGAALGDQINLAEIDANVLVAGNQAFTYIGAAAFTAAGQLRYSGGVLQGSTDGDTAAEFEIELVGTPTLTVGGTGTDILL